VVHRLRTRERFLLDAPHGAEIDRRLRGRSDAEQAEKKDGADVD
jgi:hypothetical protein